MKNNKLRAPNSLSFQRSLLDITSRMSLAMAIAIVALSLHIESAMAQIDLMPSHVVEMTVDSGDHFNDDDEPQIVWTDEVRVKGAQWVRLDFSYLVLAYDQLGNTSSTLRITSLKDGAVQLLDGVSARQWRNTSAYFNGSAVRLELIAWPNGRMNRVTVDSVMAGEIPAAEESICDSVDDRILSDDVRAGRTDGGCTGWLFNSRQNCMLTAGHCAGSTNVMLFNVPLSSSNGSYNFPGPDDQYSVDQSSKQFANGGIGNDWCYFGCFPNSNTGLSALDAQGDSYQLETPPTVGGGDQIRITGYGTTSSPVSPTWNGAQKKTQVGPYLIFSASSLGYRTDTTGGNSGSPVIFEGDGTAIGIHTNGGCSSGGSGNNWGTGANNGGFQNALANPLGICSDGVKFEYPNGRPSQLDPAGGTTVRVLAVNGGVEPEPGTGMLHYDVGNGFQSVAMTQVSPNVYDAVFPSSDCGSVVAYYFSAESTDADLYTDPTNAPTDFYSVISANDVQIAFEDDFQTNMGWGVSGNAKDGQWQRGVPAGGGDRGDPPTDGDGSGSCYVTDNVAGNSDVDGGSTILTSPTMDATVSSGESAIISYYRWFSNDFGSAPDDIFEIEISNNNGSTWVDLETVGPTGPEVSGGWIQQTFCISDFVTPTNQMRIRFTASDLGNGSVVEAGVDGVKIEIVDCGSPPATVSADNLTVVRGNQTGGTLADTADSDDSYVSFQPGLTLDPKEAPVWLVFDGSLPSDSPNTLDLVLESSAVTGGMFSTTLEAWNWNTNSYDIVDVSPASVGSDTVTTVDLTSDYVQSGTGAVRSRVGWRLTGFAAQVPWNVQLDQLVWKVNQ